MHPAVTRDAARSTCTVRATCTERANTTAQSVQAECIEARRQFESGELVHTPAEGPRSSTESGKYAMFQPYELARPESAEAALELCRSARQA